MTRHMKRRLLAKASAAGQAAAEGECAHVSGPGRWAARPRVIAPRESALAPNVLGSRGAWFAVGTLRFDGVEMFEQKRSFADER